MTEALGYKMEMGRRMSRAEEQLGIWYSLPLCLGRKEFQGLRKGEETRLDTVEAARFQSHDSSGAANWNLPSIFRASRALAELCPPYSYQVYFEADSVLQKLLI